jgi:hypothetical protein
MKPYDTSRYFPSNFDQYLCLKPPMLLMIALLFLSRALALPLFLWILQLTGGPVDDASMMKGFWSATALPAAVPAFAIVVAFVRRVPSASLLLRWVWTHGRALLAVSAVLDLTANAYIMVSREALEGPSVMLSLMAGGLDLVFLAYVLSSRRVRDAFSDFPPALASI